MDVINNINSVYDDKKIIKSSFQVASGYPLKFFYREGYYLGRLFATLASTLLDVRIYDTQCGAKIFRSTDDLKIVLSKPFLSSWIFDVELIDIEN